MSYNQTPQATINNVKVVPVVNQAMQAVVAGTITANGQSVVITDLRGIGAVTFQFSGTYSGFTGTFEVSVDNGTTWIAANSQNINSGAIGTTTGALSNANAAYNLSPLLGIAQVRVRATAFTSGTVNVIINPSTQFVQYQNIQVQGGVSVSAIVPGTGATNLGKAEDAVHASGDIGVAMWGVRNDGAAATLTSATGDYSAQAVDDHGVAFARNSPATAATPTSITAATTSTQIVAANTNRRSVVLYNNSTSDCYVKYGTAAANTSFTFYLPSMGTTTIGGDEWAGVIHAIWISANGNMMVTETT